MFPSFLLVRPPPQAGDPPNRPGALEAELEFLRAFEGISKTSVEAGYQADVLKWAAGKRYRQRRNLNFLAGLIALLSGAAVAAVVTGLSTAFIVRSLAILTTVFSGLLSLVDTHINDDCGVEQLLDCAAELRRVQKLAELFQDRLMCIELETKAKLAAARHLPDEPHRSEPRRVSRRLQSLRGWSNGEAQVIGSIFARDPRSSG